MTRLLTIPELADRLRISRRSAYRVAREMGYRERCLTGVTDNIVERYIAERTRNAGVSRHPLAALLADVETAARLVERGRTVWPTFGRDRQAQGFRRRG